MAGRAMDHFGESSQANMQVMHVNLGLLRGTRCVVEMTGINRGSLSAGDDPPSQRSPLISHLSSHLYTLVLHHLKKETKAHISSFADAAFKRS